MSTLILVAAIIAAIVGFVLWLDYARRAAEQTGAKLQAAKTTEKVNVDVATAITAERASDALPVSSLRAPDSDSRD